MLSFKQGDIIEIADRADSEDWVLGSFGEKTGWVPSEHLRLLYGKPSAFKGKDKLKESEKAKADAKQQAAAAVAAPNNLAEFIKAVEACMLEYAKLHFRIDDGADSRSFSAGTMKGTLKMLASATKTKLPEHMKESKEKPAAELEKEMGAKILFTTVGDNLYFPFQHPVLILTLPTATGTPERTTAQVRLEYCGHKGCPRSVHL